MKKVLPGQSFVVSATDWNALTDIVESYKRSLMDGGAGTALPGGDSAVILARNDSGQNLDRFAVVVVTGVVFGPNDNLDEYLNRPTFIIEVLGGGE
ncbi:MAG: hypothetical protein N3A38_14045 [Planctomycetota bacterium]|nr:hypothetical protein [Planctomycetota bacterium]